MGLQRQKQIRGSRKGKFLILIVLVCVVSIVVIGALFYSKQSKNKKDSMAAITANSIDIRAIEQPSHDEVLADSDSKFREFTQEEFRLFYDNLLQPNVIATNIPPVITGDDVADTRIRQLAEKRGYKLRGDVETGLETVASQRLQPTAVTPWLDFQESARQAGHDITITSAYRSIEDQRALFLSRLNAEGVSISDVANGDADDAVTKVLVTTAIPGYSKHHTGYTVDLLCAGYAFESFKNSTCFNWLKENNYERVKEFGFIPSYPDESMLQGPDPEAWEYVYVGVDALLH